MTQRRNQGFGHHGGKKFAGKLSHESGRLPQDRPMPYYLDDNKEQLDPSLVDGKALDWAQQFGKQLKTTQMRRFYDDFKAIERRILQGESNQAQEENLKRDLALIKMFKAKALYAEKRNVAPRAFTQFMFDHIASIKDLKDLLAFSKIFESVVAFHRFFSKDN